jgi:type II secretory pathway component PulF
LSNAVIAHDTIFDELARALILAGQKTGNLASTIEQLADHNEAMALFRHRLASALIVPLITLACFTVIMVAIFIMVIPRFEPFFESCSEPLPQSTELILAISRGMRSFKVVYAAVAAVLCYSLGKPLAKRLKSPVLARLLSLSVLWSDIYKVRLLSVLGTLLTSGIHIVDALRIVRSTVHNHRVVDALDTIISAVEGGNNLSNALKTVPFFSSSELIALVTVGESSGQLGPMIIQAHILYQQRVYSRLQRLTSLVQPLLLMVLGLLIAGLILAVYMPLFTLSSII